MQRRIDANSRAGLWIERIAWNAAAAAVLAGMILVLLGSLQWLEQVAPSTGNADNRPSVSASAQSTGGLEGNSVGVSLLPRDFVPQTSAVNRPSG